MVLAIGGTSRNMNSGCSLGHSRSDEDLPRQFPAGLRVLVVDDDMTCLMILERMLKNCDYIGEPLNDLSVDFVF